MAEKTLPKTVKIMVDGQKVTALVRVDGNGEFAVYTKPDERNPKGRVFFFPHDPKSDDPAAELAGHVDRHNEANKVKPVFAEDVEDTTDHELEAWLASGPEDAETEEEIVPDDAE